MACELRWIHGDPNDPLPLLFLHSGNIFWDGRQSYVGGVENMLLGVRPRDYVKYRHHMDRIDELMFGEFKLFMYKSNDKIFIAIYYNFNL